MITKFKVENFKSFSNSEDMNFAPITLIYGPNSSGKSSVIQALLMLKQTFEKKNGNGELETGGNCISLGNFNNIIHGQENSLTMSFNIQYSNEHDALEFRHRHSYKMMFGKNENRNLQVSYNKEESSENAYLSYFHFNCNDKVNFSLKRGRLTSNGYSYSINEKNNLRNIIAKRNNITPNDGPSFNELDESLLQPFKIDSNYNIPRSFTHKSHETMLSTYTNQLLDDISYIFYKTKYLGPLRSSPKRFYTSEISSYQKGQGKGNLGFDLFTSTPDTLEKINNYLHNFSIPYQISTKNIGDSQTGKIISILLKDIRRNTTVTPKDVGFGIGQVLPIILDGIISEKQLILVEQPEIHLHPKLQAHLADLFIDSVVENRNQWVIETHSEALILRIQRRIREKKIKKELVSVLYIDVGENGATVTELPLDDDGDFTRHWPGGFFEERLDELFGGHQ